MTFPDSYLHDLVAHPAEVPPFSGFLPQQVIRVVAESALTIQTQGHSAQGHSFSFVTHCSIFPFVCWCVARLAFCECVPSGTEAERAQLHPNKFLRLKNKDENVC